jgi:hypothetical protein
LATLGFAALLLAGRPVGAMGPGPTIHLFGSANCDLCQEAAAYLRTVAAREGVPFIYHDPGANTTVADLQRETARVLDVRVSGYPFIVVGRHSEIGWDKERVGLRVEDALTAARYAGEGDAVETAAASLRGDSIARQPSIRRFPSVAWSFPIVALVSASAWLVWRRRS